MSPTIEKELRSSSDPRLVREDSNASSEKSARHSYDAKSEDGIAPPAYYEDPLVVEPLSSNDHDLGHIPPPSSHQSLSHTTRSESRHPPRSSTHIHRTRARSPKSTPTYSSHEVSIPGEYARPTSYGSSAYPSYAEKKYEKQSLEEERRNRKRDYAIEISRIMGKQLVKTLKPGAGIGDGAAS